MFQFTGLTSVAGYRIFNTVGCPIGRFTDQELFALPRNFSQLITSFVVSESQGIRHAPLFTFLVGVRRSFCQRSWLKFRERTLKHYFADILNSALHHFSFSCCSVSTNLLFESYVFQYVKDRFDLFGRVWWIGLITGGWLLIVAGYLLLVAGCLLLVLSSGFRVLSC